MDHSAFPSLLGLLMVTKVASLRQTPHAQTSMLITLYSLLAMVSTMGPLIGGSKIRGAQLGVRVATSAFCITRSESTALMGVWDCWVLASPTSVPRQARPNQFQ